MNAPSEELECGELLLHGRIMPASNATFLGQIGEHRVVYKPISGERPLWDFPVGTLADREVAAYLVSEALGWNVVPPTWLRDGPHGPGMVQLWQEPDPEQEAVTLVEEGAVPAGWKHVFDGIDGRDLPVSLVHEDSEPLRRMAVFDVASTTPTARAATCSRWPTGTGTASTTASPSTSSTSSGRSSGAGWGTRCRRRTSTTWGGSARSWPGRSVTLSRCTWWTRRSTRR